MEFEGGFISRLEWTVRPLTFRGLVYRRIISRLLSHLHLLCWLPTPMSGSLKWESLMQYQGA